MSISHFFIFQATTNGKSFMYVMTQQPQYNHTGPEVVRKAEFCECDHGDDIVFTFGLPLSNRRLISDFHFTEDEKNLSREWMNYIVNFATNGYVDQILLRFTIAYTK